MESRFWFKYISLLYVFNLTQVSAENCHFIAGSNWKKSSIPESECPCFHSEGDLKNTSCFGPNNPLGPVVECAFLPREFIECGFPVDHKGNLTAKQQVGTTFVVKSKTN